MISIERKCDRTKNPLLTISKKELITILKKFNVKGLYKKNKIQLCQIFQNLQKKHLRRRVIGKKSKKKKSGSLIIITFTMFLNINLSLLNFLKSNLI